MCKVFSIKMLDYRLGQEIVKTLKQFWIWRQTYIHLTLKIKCSQLSSEMPMILTFCILWNVPRKIMTASKKMSSCLMSSNTSQTNSKTLWRNIYSSRISKTTLRILKMNYYTNVNLYCFRMINHIWDSNKLIRK